MNGFLKSLKSSRVKEWDEDKAKWSNSTAGFPRLSPVIFDRFACDFAENKLGWLKRDEYERAVMIDVKEPGQADAHARHEQTKIMRSRAKKQV